MTATLAPETSVPVLPPTLAIARRSLVNVFRIPAAFIPILAMPVFFVIAFSGSFSSLTNLPSFPTDNILNWMVPFAMIQGSAFAGFSAGFGTVRDLETGFYDRLLLAPGSRVPLLVGPLLAGIVRATISVVVVFSVGVLFGADFPGGASGLLVLWVAAAGIAIIATGWALGVVYRVQGAQSGPLLQVGIFFTTFLSTGNVPIASQTGWVKVIASKNPLTNVLQLARQGYLGHVHWSTTWPGLVALAASGAVLWIFAARGVRKLIP
ncbi:MAG: type transport system permease protein [Nocardioidaceae bacterium]|nr:type transport system permease protein [Nocardioidaceae bacterium]